MEQAFASAVALLPSGLRGALNTLPTAQRVFAEEIRLRLGRPVAVTLPGGERSVCPDRPVTTHDLEMVLEAATQGSTHTALERLRAGFVTLRGGHRLGLCGAVVCQGGEVSALRQLSSVCLRVARAVHGAADGLPARIWNGWRPYNTLILSPPGLGKTTLLRDLIRQVSDGGTHGLPCRVSLADERGEVAACYQGRPQLAVGGRTDVLDGCPKAAGAVWLLRGMAPQVLAMDEITAPEDIQALQYASGCGAALLATAHADSPADLRRRPLYRTLPGLFDRLILIRRQGDKRVYEVQAMPGGAGDEDGGEGRAAL
jgi:stage III sporulation protein AA